MKSNPLSRQAAEIAKDAISIVWHHDPIDFLSSCSHFLLGSVGGTFRGYLADVFFAIPAALREDAPDLRLKVWREAVLRIPVDVNWFMS